MLARNLIGRDRLAILIAKAALEGTKVQVRSSPRYDAGVKLKRFLEEQK